LGELGWLGEEDGEEDLSGPRWRSDSQSPAASPLPWGSGKES